jgi:hypothetical protein
MRAIVYNNAAQAEALQARVHNRVKGIKSYVAKRYSNLHYHPTNGKVAVAIELDEKHDWNNDLIEELTPGEINNIETLSADWFPNTEL